jgi:hypothetical protein
VHVIGLSQPRDRDSLISPSPLFHDPALDIQAPRRLQILLIPERLLCRPSMQVSPPRLPPHPLRPVKALPVLRPRFWPRSLSVLPLTSPTGFCRRGDQCWFKHTVDTPPAAAEDDRQDDPCSICFEMPITYGLLCMSPGPSMLAWFSHFPPHPS